MRRTNVVLWSAVALYISAWFLPVADGGITLAQGGVPGWEAFRLALSPFWHYRGSGGGSGILDWLGALSALTNVWFLLAVAALAAGRERFRGIAFGGLVLSAPLNALWFVLGDDRAGLRIGYYAWFVAFVVLAVAAYPFLREAARQCRRPVAA